MQIKVFTIPMYDSETAENEINSFLRGHKIITVDKQLVQTGNNACWTFCITYIQGNDNNAAASQQKKTDYKELLDEQTFAVFLKLRAIRKELADSDAVPAYAVFTDAELAEIAKLEHIDTKSIQAIPNVGKKKAEKYGKSMCEKFNQAAQLQAKPNEEGRLFD